MIWEIFTILVITLICFLPGHLIVTYFLFFFFATEVVVIEVANKFVSIVRVTIKTTLKWFAFPWRALLWCAECTWVSRPDLCWARGRRAGSSLSLHCFSFQSPSPGHRGRDWQSVLCWNHLKYHFSIFSYKKNQNSWTF